MYVVCVCVYVCIECLLVVAALQLSSLFSERERWKGRFVIRSKMMYTLLTLQKPRKSDILVQSITCPPVLGVGRWAGRYGVHGRLKMIKVLTYCQMYN